MFLDILPSEFLGVTLICFEKRLHLLLETLVVTAVTEARETVSGSRDSASRIAFLSRSSMSRIAGSSKELKAVLKLLILLSDFDTSDCLESFTCFSMVVFLDLAKLHGRENSLPSSAVGDNWRIRSHCWVCPQINQFLLLFHQTNQLSFHLCNPNRSHIAHICVTRRDIQFQRNNRPYPIAATSPSAVRTLNHKTRGSSVSTLILTGSNISVPTKSFWCLQENNKWGS